MMKIHHLRYSDLRYSDMIDVLQPLKLGYRHTSRIQVLHGHNIKHLS